MMGVAASRDVTALAALALFLAYLIAERAWELRLSARHQERLRARGAVERGRRHYPLLVALHVVFPVALAAEVLVGGSRPGSGWPLWLALWTAAQGLRFWAVRALGEFWNVRIWVVPGMEPIRRGPYRSLRHPNYLAVAVELVSGPMIFGAWRTALAISALNLVALGVRIQAEERALEEASRGGSVTEDGAPGRL